MNDDTRAKADIVEYVREGYAGAADRATAGHTLVDPCGTPVFGAGLYDATTALGDIPAGAAAAGLGCGNPLAVADLAEGDTVLDLGSGSGIDALVRAQRPEKP